MQEKVESIFGLHPARRDKLRRCTFYEKIMCAPSHTTTTHTTTSHTTTSHTSPCNSPLGHHSLLNLYSRFLENIPVLIYILSILISWCVRKACVSKHLN